MSTPATIGAEPDEEATARERVAALIEDRLDIPMAVLAVVWACLVGYELVAPPEQRNELTLIGNVIWGLFVVEFVAKLVVSGQPIRFLRRRWPSIFFLALPALRIFRVIRAVRVLRALPAARVVGSSYRSIGTARSLLGGRLSFLVVTTLVAVFSGGQLLYLVEGRLGGGEGTFADALWWSANLAISGAAVFEPTTGWGRLVAMVLSIYAMVVFASTAATIGSFFIESRNEQAAAEDASEGAGGAPS